MSEQGTLRNFTLRGKRNFRDIGGYSTNEGRIVRRGLVYRSGALSHLTDSDCSELDSLEIQVLCDFRSRREREREPVNWPGMPRVSLQWDYDASRSSLRELLEDPEISAETAEEGMIRHYEAIPFEFTDQFAELFNRLASGDLPLVFTCSAGKDRTGVAAALILTSLGVPWNQVQADYELTDRYVNLELELFQDSTRGIGLGDGYGIVARLPSEVRAPLLRSSRKYLQAAFSRIVNEHGSVNRYLYERLGMTDSQLQEILRRLLEQR